MKRKMSGFERLKSNRQIGWGVVESLILICVVGIIALIIINGLTTTALVFNQVGDKDQIEKLATSYLNHVKEQATSQSFYENMPEGEYPPIPLLSEYTDSGRYSVIVETIFQEDKSKKVLITFRNPGSTTFEDPLMVLSVVIEDPQSY